MASDIERVVRWSKRFESHLESRFGAEGRGLHEKVSAVEHKLGSQTVKDLRFVATIRNKLLHDATYTRIDDRAAFRARTRRAAKALRLSGGGMKLAVMLGSLLVAAAATAAIMWLRLR